MRSRETHRENITMTESWRTVPDYEFYDVSDLGRVRSWNGNTGSGPTRRKEPWMLKPGLNVGGYLMVSLCKNGQCNTVTVHRLVLTAFVGPRPAGLECCHSDGIRSNNHLDNLRWDTRSANRQDAIAHGTWSPPRLQGEANGMTKLTEIEIVEIRRLHAAGGVNYPELGAQFGVERSTIGLIIRRATWAS